jgi:hypothetical protein
MDSAALTGRTKSLYGSEGWGFESLRARFVPGQGLVFSIVDGGPSMVFFQLETDEPVEAQRWRPFLLSLRSGRAKWWLEWRARSKGGIGSA